MIAHTYNPSTSEVATGGSLGSVTSRSNLTGKNQIFERISQRGSESILRMTPKVVLHPAHPCTPIYNHAHTDTNACTKIKVKKEWTCFLGSLGASNKPRHPTGAITHRNSENIWKWRRTRRIPVDPVLQPSLSQSQACEQRASHHLNSGGLQSTEPHRGLI